MRWFTGRAARHLAALMVYAFGTGFSGALMPGPLLSVTVADAARNGFWAGPLLMAGHGALELGIIVGLAAGLGGVLRRRAVFAALGVVGGAVLAWMGWAMLGPVGAAQSAAPDATTGLLAEVPRGLLITLSNPYWTLWWATVGMALIARAKQYGTPGLGTLFVGHLGSDVVWYSLVALGIAYGRELLSAAAYQLLMRVCGVFLIALAAYFIYSGAREALRRVAGGASSRGFDPARERQDG